MLPTVLVMYLKDSRFGDSSLLYLGGMASTSNVSVWWPTPADPYRHFSVEQIDASEQYFRPLRRGAAFGLAGRFVGLLSAAGLATVLAKTDVAGTFGFVWHVLIGSAMTLVAVRLPAVVVDTWFEYRHQLVLDGHQPVAKRRFVGVVTVLNMAYGLAIVVAAFGGYLLAGWTNQWPIIVAVALIIGVALSAARQFGLLGTNSVDETDLPADLALDLEKVAARFGVSNLAFRCASTASESTTRFATSAFSADCRTAGLNAYSVGLGSNQRVVLSDTLVSEPEETRNFVVGHELAHQAKHHLGIQAALTTLLYLIGLVVLAGFTRLNQPWQFLELDPIDDPLGLPVIALFVFCVAGLLGPVKGWISRGHERIADETAARALAPPTVQQSHRIHFSTEVDLVPPRWVQAYASHPAPYERLEFLARLRRST